MCEIIASVKYRPVPNGVKCITFSESKCIECALGKF